MIGTWSLQSVDSVCSIRWYANIPYKIWEHFYTSKFHIFSNKHPQFLFNRCLCPTDINLKETFIWGVFLGIFDSPIRFPQVLNTQTKANWKTSFSCNYVKWTANIIQEKWILIGKIPCAEVFLKTGMHYKGVVNGPLENKGLSNFHFVLDWIALGSFLYVLSLILNPWISTWGTYFNIYKISWWALIQRRHLFEGRHLFNFSQIMTSWIAICIIGLWPILST